MSETTDILALTVLGDLKQMTPPRKMVDINSAQLSGMALEGKWKLTLDNGRHYNDGRKSDGIIHDDLKACFEQLVPHLILLSDTREAVQLEQFLLQYQDELAPGAELFNIELWPQDVRMLLENVKVYGFAIKGEDESTKVSLNGNKYRNDKTIKLHAPDCALYARGSNVLYAYTEELQVAIEHAKNEVYDYLFLQKEAKKQLALELDPDQNTIPEGEE
jgi:hypothetical protein